MNARIAREIADRACETAAQMYKEEVCRAVRKEAEFGNYALPTPLAVPEQYSKNKDIMTKVIEILTSQLHYVVEYNEETKTLSVDWRNAK